MQTDINERLTRVIVNRRLRDKLARDLKQAQRSLEEQSALLDTLERQLAKEQVDVERLERLSLTRLFHAVLGSREEQMDKERQELLAAQLKYQQAKRAVENLQSDQTHLERQLHDLRGVDAEYAALLASKERLLPDANPQAAEQVLRLTEQIANRAAEVNEIDEAVGAGRSVLGSLEAVVDALQSAEGWGTWDMLGGGFLSTAIKHSRIDDARDAVSEVQANMRRFNRELADVRRSTDFQIDIGGLEIFADFFFDSLIVDWIVQSKIHESLEQSRRAHASVAGALKELEKLRARVYQDVDRLKAQRAALIEGA